MRKFQAILLVLLPILVLSEVPRYDQVRIWISSADDIRSIQSVGVDLEGNRYKQDTFIDLILSEDEIEAVNGLGLPVETLQIDMSSVYRQHLNDAIRPWGMGSMGGYYTFDEVLESMDSLHAQYPDLVSARDSIGGTHEGRGIWAFKISNSPGFPEAEPEVFFNSLIHAREPASMMTLLYYAWYLVENYDIDPFVQYLVDNRQIWFVPVINADGYVYNEVNDPAGGGLHRKNLRPETCFSNPGIDLNRNWGFMWGYDNNGSSPDLCSATYRGTDPFSEPETQAVRDFVQGHDFKAVFNTHTYGDLLIRPFGFDESVPLPQPDSSAYVELGHDLVAENGYLFGTGSETVMYTVNGDAVDYMYGELGIINFTPEIGPNFWPPSDEILDLALENVPMFLRLTNVVGDALYLSDVSISGDGGISENTDYTLTVDIRNKGLAPSPAGLQYAMRLSSPDGSLATTPMDLVYSAAPATQTSITAQDSFTVLAAASEMATLIIELHIQSGDYEYLQEDTVQWRVGVPDTLFFDDFENGLDLWSHSDWGIQSNGFEGTNSAADSPNSDYPNQTVTTMALAASVDLTAFVAPLLAFDLKYEIETNWDFAQVQASCDGGNSWTPLSGNYTNTGSGDGVQDQGEPGYDGTRDWVREEIPLENYASCDNLLIRFWLGSDTYITGDGIVVDNFAVLGWPAQLVGDLNDDEIVNIIDVVLAIEWVFDSTLEAYQLELGDLNGDGALNIMDVIQLLEIVLD